MYLFLIILLGTFLRLYNLGIESFWFDEIYTVHQVSQDSQTLIHQLIIQGDLTRNAIYYLLAHFWVLPYGVTEVSIRSLSALFGVLSIGMMYLVGNALFGTQVGLLSSFLMAISTFQIQHSQDARFYSLFVLLTLVSLYFYILAIKTKQLWLWIISSLINILLFYTHTYAIFVFAVEYIHYFIYWKNNKDALIQWVTSQTLLIFTIVVGFIPMLREEGSVVGLSKGLAWITVPSFRDLLRTVYGYLFPQNYQHSWLFISASFFAATVFFIIGIFSFNIRRIRNRSFAELRNWVRNTQFLPPISSELILVAIWLIFPVMLPFIYSRLFSPIFADRYMICAAPAFYLLIAIAILRVSRVIPISLSLGALMIVIIPGLQDYYVSDINEQWREVGAYVQENGYPNDVIVIAPDANGYQTKSFDWYYQGALPSCGISSIIDKEQEIARILADCTMTHDRFWVVMRGPPEVVSRFKSFILNPNLTTIQLINERHFVEISVYLFDLSR